MLTDNDKQALLIIVLSIITVLLIGTAVEMTTSPILRFLMIGTVGCIGFKNGLIIYRVIFERGKDREEDGEGE